MFLIMVVAVTKLKGNENNQNKINKNKNNKKCYENKKFHMNKNVRIFFECIISVNLKFLTDEV